MDNITLETYLLSLSDADFIIEGLSPSLIKDMMLDIKGMKAENVQSFLKKNGNKVKPLDTKKMEDEVEKVAEKNGLEKDNVTTSRVMLKRFLGTVFVGVPVAVLFPITIACWAACVIRSIKNKQPILKNTLSFMKEIRSGIKTTRRINITNMEKAIITAGQATDYLWGALSDKPLVILKNLLAFIGMYIAAIYYFWKGMVFSGEQIKK